jgi:hypothetical protein
VGLDRFLVGFLFALFLVSCAGAGFSYHYYGLSQVSFANGKLLGPTEQDDLPFSKCSPEVDSKNPCVVMFAKDFFSLKQDYEDSKMRLADCEKPVSN